MVDKLPFPQQVSLPDFFPSTVWLGTISKMHTKQLWASDDFFQVLMFFHSPKVPFANDTQLKICSTSNFQQNRPPPSPLSFRQCQRSTFLPIGCFLSEFDPYFTNLSLTNNFDGKKKWFLKKTIWQNSLTVHLIAQHTIWGWHGMTIEPADWIQG